MVDDCNIFFKGKADGRVARSAALAAVEQKDVDRRPT
jgi:hypothetical protein